MNQTKGRWLVVGRWLPLVVLALDLSGGLGRGQSLAEVAKKEKERREKLKGKPVRVITDRDVAIGGVLPSAAPEQASAAGSGATTGTSPTAPGAASAPDPAKTREYWQKRVEEAQKKVQDLEAELQSPEASWGGGIRTDVNPLGQRNLERRQEVERKLAEARAAVETIREEARRAGIPAAWVR